MKRVGIRLGATLVATLSLAAAASALPLNGSAIELEAGDDASFDPSNEDEGGCFNADATYTPVDHGELGANDDAFDGGLIMHVEGRPFADPNDDATPSGQQITVGPSKLAGIRVRRIDRALPGSPTLRDLVQLKNTTRRKQTRSVLLHTDLGSDSDTLLEASSSGNSFLSRADRWAITSDEAPFDDPIVSHVLFGKGKVTRPSDAVGAYQFDGTGEECLFINFRVKLRPKQTRYLLFFLEMNDSRATAISRVAKFNRRKLNGALKAGLSRRVKQKIINWDLVG